MPLPSMRSFSSTRQERCTSTERIAPGRFDVVRCVRKDAHNKLDRCDADKDYCITHFAWLENDEGEMVYYQWSEIRT